MTSKKCDCNICTRNRAFRARLEQLDEPQRPYFDTLNDVLQETEMDRDYYRALLDGSWPNADEVIAGFRARFAAKTAEAPPSLVPAPADVSHSAA